MSNSNNDIVIRKEYNMDQMIDFIFTTKGKCQSLL